MVPHPAVPSIIACTLRDNNHVAFMAGWEAGNAEMQIRQCTVYGRVWHTIDRPGDNRFTVTSMTQASRDVAQDRTDVAQDRTDLSFEPLTESFHEFKEQFTASPADSQDDDGPGWSAQAVGNATKGTRRRYVNLGRTRSDPNIHQERQSSPVSEVPRSSAPADTGLESPGALRASGKGRGGVTNTVISSGAWAPGEAAPHHEFNTMVLFVVFFVEEKNFFW